MKTPPEYQRLIECKGISLRELGVDDVALNRETFINKGTNGRWRDTLSAGETAAYEAKAVKELGPACAKWLAQGHAKYKNLKG